MKRVISRTTSGMALSALLCLNGTVAAQREFGLPAPEPPEVEAHLAAARAAAGAEWRQAFFYFCDTSPRINSPSDPQLPPTKIFDNLYYIGSAGTGSWIVQTSAGLVMIDTGYVQHLESVLLSGMAELKLNPADVKYIFAGHGVWDHWGGAAYFQKKYGTRVVMGEQSGWVRTNREFRADAPRTPGPNQVGVSPNYPPRYTVAPTFDPARDITVTDEYVLTVGDTKFTIVEGDGGIRIAFPVKDGATTHVAGLFGGTVLVPSWRSNKTLREYVVGLNTWAAQAKRLNVDVEIQNHPLFDGITEKMEGVRAGKKGRQHPFVVGIDGYQRLFTVMAECTQVHLARRAAGTALPYNTTE